MQQLFQLNVTMKSKLVAHYRGPKHQEAILIEFCRPLCRKCSLSGISLLPKWIPSVSVGSAENQMDFNLQLMTGI